MDCQLRSWSEIPPASAPTTRRRFLRFGKLSVSSSPKPSPQSTPRSLRKHFRSLGDILKCGSSLPSVDSIQFNNEEEDELDCQQRLQNTRSSEQLHSSSQTPIMGNRCTKRATLRRAYTSSDDEDELTESKEEEKVTLMRRAPNECFASVANHENGDLDDERMVRSARAVTSPLERMKVSAHSTPTSSPQRQKPKFWQNFTQQFKTSSRESLQRMHPKRTIFRKFSAGPEFAPKKKTLEKSKTTHLHMERPTETDPLLQKEADEDSTFVTFRLRIHLKEGHGLVIRDASGSSDPYVKFKYNNKTIYKSNTVLKNLNPKWNEEFSFLIHDPLLKLDVDVFDYDRFMRDDFMGGGQVDLSQLKLFEKHQVDVKLEGGEEEYMGGITLELEITPLTKKQQDLFLSRADRGVICEAVKRNPKSASVWLSVVNVVLVEARLDQTILSANQQAPDVYAKLKLNNEKCKSKVIPKSFEPKWAETFDLHIFDETTPQILDVMVCHKNTVLGKCSIDLSTFEHELTKERWYDLDNGSGSIRMLTTISGTSTSSTVVANLDEYVSNRDVIIDKYSLQKSFTKVTDVGHLTCKVYRAEGLASADIGGKSDPFCVLELVNARLQTQTIYKTLDPTWDKLFTFSVKDIHEVLEVTIYDEDPNKKVEFLGKVAIPLLKIRNCEKRWYGLKDRKLRVPVKGRVLLELDVLWNPVKAAVRTFNPRERKFLAQEQRFKRAILVNNWNRLKGFWDSVMEYREYMRSCLMWESYPRSIAAMTCFVIFTYFFELFHIPIILLLLFAKSNVHKRISEAVENRYRARSAEADGTPIRLESDEDEDGFDNSASQRSRRSNNEGDGKEENGKAAEKSTSISGRISAIQNTLTTVQNAMDFLACLMERIRNTFNFTVPYLSYLAITVLCIGTILLYLVPLRWLVMVWGLNKFTKRLRKPHYIENNELLDFLSRVPSDQELRNYRELRTNCEEPRASSSGRESNRGTLTSNSPTNNGSIKKTV